MSDIQDNTSAQQWALILNATLTAIMLVVITVYFCKVFKKIKFRSSVGSRVRMFLIALALLLRFSLSVYDCTISTKAISR